MKKSVKILTLVLSLALICGALVVAAFADTDTEIVGIHLDVSGDFENPTVTDIPTAESAGANDKTTTIDQDGSLRALQFKHQKGGKPVLVNNPNDGNTYLTVDWTQNINTSNGGHFFDMYHGKGSDYKQGQWGVWKDETDAPLYGSKIEYIVLDADLMWENPEKYDGTGFFFPYFGYTTTSGGFKNLNEQVGVRFIKTSGGVAAKLYGEDDSYVLGSKGYWSHLTFIMGFEVVDNNVVVTQYLAIDGKIVDMNTYINDVDASTVWANDKTRLYARDLRFNVFGTKDTSGSVDNVNLRSIEVSYNGNLETVLAKGVGADLTTWESAIYKDGYKMPFGEVVATVGEANFDKLANAIAAADANTPIYLKKNITDSVVVDKPITIVLGDYTIADITTADGLSGAIDPETGNYVVQTSQSYALLLWEPCACPLCAAAGTSDPTHPGDTTGEVMVEAYLNNKISTYYENATGKSAAWTYSDGPITYALVGWMDYDTGDIYEIDATITEDMVEVGSAILIPVVETRIATITYTKGGQTVYTSSLATAITNGDAGTTIYFNDRVRVTAPISISKAVTIDLNGCVLDALTTNADDGVTKKADLFNIKAKGNLTIIGEKEGSAILFGYWNGSKWAGDQMLSMDASGATATLKGKNLVVAAAQLAGAWGANFTLNIEGGTYMNDSKMSDGMAWIYGNADVTNAIINVKDATIDVYSGFIGFYGTATVNFDGCKIVRTPVPSSLCTNLTVNVKNSYIGAKLNGNVNVGLGNYIVNKDYVAGAKFVDGATMIPDNTTLDVTTYANTRVLDDNLNVLPDSYKFTTATKTLAFTAYTVNGVTVNFVDGSNILTTVAGLIGEKVVGPATGKAAVPVADGWVMASEAYAYTILEGDTGTVNVDINETTEYGYIYSMGTPKLYVNYKLTENLTSNLYIPYELPEGVSLGDINYGGHTAGRTLSGNFKIGGVDHGVTMVYPGAWNADDSNIYWLVNYTYEGADFQFKAKLNVVDYSKKVVEMYAEDTEKLQQVTALLQYVEAANKIKMLTDSTEAIENGLSEYLAELKTTVTIPTITADTAYVSDIAALVEYIRGVQVDVNPLRGAAMNFNLTDKAVAEKVTINVHAGETNIGTVTNLDGKVAYLDQTNLTQWGASDLTIKVYVDGEVVATGTYSLAAYKNEMSDKATADQLALLDAIYALAYIGDVNN